MELPSEASPAVIVDGGRAILLGGLDERREWSRAVWVYEGGGWSRSEPLTLLAPWPRAWLRGDRIVIVGQSTMGPPLMVLDARSLQLLEERMLPPLPHGVMHLDAAQQLWLFQEPTTAEPSEPLPEGLRWARAPVSCAALLELASGALLGWSWGGPDPGVYGRPAGAHEASLYRFDPLALSWSRIGAVPTGLRGLTNLSLELPDGSVLLLTDHGDLLRVDPAQGTASLCAGLDEDKSAPAWRAGLLVAAGEDQVVVLGRDRAVRVRPSTGAIDELQPPRTVRLSGAALPDGEHLLLLGGQDAHRRGIPPERFPLIPCARRPRRPDGLRVLLPVEPPRPRFVPGERVQVVDGPLSGLYGTVREMDGERVKLEVSLFGSATPATVEIEALRKLEGA